MRFVAFLFSLVLCAGHLRADQVFLFKGKPLDNVRVVEETFKEVKYQVLGVRQPQTVAADQVKEVIYENPTPEYSQARAAQLARQYSQAIEMFKVAADDPPKRNRWERQYGLFMIAECYRGKRDYASALKAYDDLLKRVPDTRFYGDAFVGKARCHESQGDKSKARSMYERLRSEVGSKGISQRWDVLGEFEILRLSESADPTTALAAYEDLQARADENYPDVANLARQRVGYVLISQGNVEDARKYFQEIIDDRQASSIPVVAGAYAGLGSSYVNKQNATPQDFEKALFPFLRVIYHYGDDLGQSETLAEALYWAGRCFEARAQDPEKSAQRSKELYRRVIKDFPSSPWAKQANER